METGRLIESLERGGKAFEALFAAVSEDLASWKPSPRDWSLLEIACHMLDEEREDFRVRLASTLADPSVEWSPIDPEGWVSSRGYAQRDLGEVLQAFGEERAQSLTWLRELEDPDWDLTHEREGLGRLRAGELFSSWVAHDLLHLKQVAKRLHQYAAHAARPYPSDYAGPWT